jgi:MIP family channel proteins
MYKNRLFDMISIKAIIAEFLTMTLFVFTGCGSAVLFSSPPGFITNSVNDLQLANYSWGTIVPLSFGLSITTLVYATAHLSGQINPAVTLSLMLVNEITALQGVLNIISQYAGSICGAGLLYITIPHSSSSNLGSNARAPGVSILNAFVGETVMTFILVFVVLECVIKFNRSVAGVMAPLVVGLSVFMAHTVLLPLTGCSINPARSFGPALVSGSWDDLWIFSTAPFVGGFIAIGVHKILKRRPLALTTDIIGPTVITGENTKSLSNSIINTNNQQAIYHDHGLFVGKRKSSRPVLPLVR